MTLEPLERLDPSRFDTPKILRQLNAATRQLAELKGVAVAIPSRGIASALINNLGLQEAKDSSAIENIVTTNDELFRDSLFPDEPGNLAAKEVARYRQALFAGYNMIEKHGLLTTNHILAVQAELERSRPGFRKVPGTVLRDADGTVVYTPPPPNEIAPLMSDLDHFMNDPSRSPLDPLIKMALIHHRFETIHPFYDGNGRTGRIVNVLYLVKERLLEIPVLYMSRSIVRTKGEYYRLLQDVRDRDVWDDWVIYMLAAVEETAREALAMIAAIQRAFLDYKRRIREQHRKFYSQDLINNLFSHPYTKIQFVEQELGVTRLTATKYLEALARTGFLVKQRAGRTNYYMNAALTAILAGDAPAPAPPAA